MKDYSKFTKVKTSRDQPFNSRSVDTGLDFTLNKNQFPKLSRNDRLSTEGSREGSQ